MNQTTLASLLSAGLLLYSASLPAAKWDYDTPAESRINQAAMDMLAASAERFHRRFDNASGVDAQARFDQAKLRTEITALESRFANAIVTDEEDSQQATLQRLRSKLADRIDRYEQLLSARFVEVLREDRDSWQYRLVEQAIRLDYFAVPGTLLSDQPEFAESLSRYAKLQASFEALHQTHIQ